MDTKELVNKIAKLKNAIESESDPDVKKAYQKKVDALEKQIAEAEVKVEKVEAKAAAEEKKDLNEAEVKIQKLKAALASETDPDVKDRYQKKIKQLEETLKDVKQEIKEEKKEIAEQKKDIKAATKEVKSAQKEVRKTAIKKVAAKQVERKQVVTRKAKRKTKIKSIISDLDALINKNKELKAKYKGKGVDLKRDAGRSAKPFGYRFVGKHDYRVPTEAQVRKGLKRGTIDYEGRPNRSDKYPKATARLADGGMMADGGKTATKSRYAIVFKDKEGKELTQYTTAYNLMDATKQAKKVADIYKMTLDKVYIVDDYEDEEKNRKQGKRMMKKMGMMADGGMMAHGGMSQGYDDREDERLAMKHGKMADKDLNSTHARRDDARFEERMADGGKLKDGDEVNVLHNGKVYNGKILKIHSISSVDVKVENGSIYNEPMWHIEGKMAKGGQTFNDSETDDFYEDLQVYVQGKGSIYKGKSLKEATKAFDDYYAKHPHAEIVMVDEKYGDELKWANVDSDNDDDEYKKGGTVKKKKVASKSKPKSSKKVGKSVQDKHRFAKPAGWRWKEEAFQKRIIERKQLTMSPSKKMRDKYPDLVYYEDRLNKADAKPTRSSADSI